MENQSLTGYLKSLEFKEPRAQEVARIISELANIFGAQADSLESKDPVSRSPEVLPIEVFRESLPERTHRYFKGPSIHRTFLSSGTTDTIRAISRFSEDGLNLYKLASIKTFSAVLGRFWGAELMHSGMSLIPRTAEWKHSSLAQMIEWFSQVWQVSYLSDATAFDRMGREPVWIFGTAIHFLNLFDQGLRTKLPAGSLVFETGGFKGLRRTMTRHDLYSKITQHLGIEPDRIISEYGMAELASQAYDWEDPSTNRRTGFRFPSWVRTSVTQGLQKIEAQGQGALVIEDLARVDYPYSLRTQDICTLNKNGAFSLEGRVPNAPLKGCSLSVTEILGRPQSLPVSPVAHAKWILKKQDCVERIAGFDQAFRSFCRGEEARKALGQELGSEYAAECALSDLVASLPKDLDDWFRSIERSMNETAHWLLILPNNHSIAGVYPLVFAYLAGIGMTVRLPKIGEPAGSFLHTFLSFLRNIGDKKIGVLPSTFRLGEQTLPPNVHAIMCYGASETISHLAQHTTLPIKGFGTSLSISVTTPDLRLSNDVVRDAFSLGQLGCMSTRLVVSIGGFDETLAFACRLRQDFPLFWQSPLTLGQRLAIACEETRRRGSAAVAERLSVDDPLFYVIKADKVEQIDLDGSLAQIQFCLPLVCCECRKQTTKEAVNGLLNLLARLKLVNAVTISDNLLDIASQDTDLTKLLPDVSFRRLGMGNRSPWNGLHQGSPLFSLY